MKRSTFLKSHNGFCCLILSGGNGLTLFIVFSLYCHFMCRTHTVIKITFKTARIITSPSRKIMWILLIKDYLFKQNFVNFWTKGYIGWFTHVFNMDSYSFADGADAPISENCYVCIDLRSWLDGYNHSPHCTESQQSRWTQWNHLDYFFSMFLDLTDVCPLLTKQYIQVGLQIQYVLYNF
jgi:hypothetical protein